MNDRIIEIKLGYRDAFIVAALAFLMLLMSIFQYSLMEFPKVSEFEVELLSLLLITLLISLVHEAIHLIVFRALGVRVLKVKVVRFKVVPLALMVIYDEATITQYIAVALSPQILTVILLASALISSSNVDLLLYRGPLRLFLYILYTLHLAVSSGDFYGIALTLARAKTISGKIKTVVRNGRIDKFIIERLD